MLASAAQAERSRDLASDEVGVIAHGKGGKSQHAMPADSEVVVSPHVGPPCGRIHVPEPIDLGDEPGAPPESVQPATPARGVQADDLPVRLRQPVSPG